jgi:tRNA pseudouridine13 synthase
MKPEPGQPFLPEEPVVELPNVHGRPPLSGVLRAQVRDFQVEEVLGFALRGQGEHLVLKVRKRGVNTLDAARRIAVWGDVNPSAVGFAGLKDRRAVAVQHFSVHLPDGAVPDLGALHADDLEVLDVTRHLRKLRRGNLQGNRFVLRLTDVAGPVDAAEGRLRQLAALGIPNYFGTQRFGHRASNLTGARRLICSQSGRFKPEQRRMYVSAARSHIFNRVLAARVLDGSWNELLPGEVALVGQDRREVLVRMPSDALRRRRDAWDLDPSGPLPGRAGHCLMPDGDAARLEVDVIAREGFGSWVDALNRMQVDAARRALRVQPLALTWAWEDATTLVMRFGLPAGSYATSLVRELMVVQPRNLRDSST